MSDAAQPFVAALTAANLPDWLRWSVRMGRGRQARLTVEPGGAVVVVAPSGVAPDRVVSFVQASLGRLRPMVREAEEKAPLNPVKQLIGGEGFKLFGRNHRLRLVDDGPAFEVVTGPTWSHKSQWLHLRRDVANAQTIVEWYRAEGMAYLERVLPDMASRLGVRPMPSFQVRNLDPRSPRTWATYLPRTHTISVHWAVFQADRPLVEVVAAHEMAHASRPGGKPHGRQWENRIGRLLFDWKDKQARLDEEGRSFWWGAVEDRAPEPAFEPVPVGAWEAVALW